MPAATSANCAQPAFRWQWTAPRRTCITSSPSRRRPAAQRQLQLDAQRLRVQRGEPRADQRPIARAALRRRVRQPLERTAGPPM